MDTLTPPPHIASPRNWPFFLIGFLLFVAAPALYGIQLGMGRLFFPWYLPSLFTLGVLCMAASVWQRFGIGRAVGLAFFTVLTGLCWFALLVRVNTPAYTGPALVGRTIPVFATQLADGRPFTDRDLADGKDSIVLFFRGRW